MFNKKFEDKYPDVRKPIICNGLKAIKPYRDVKRDCVKPKEETIVEEEEDNIEPEIEINVEP